MKNLILLITVLSFIFSSCGNKENLFPPPTQEALEKSSNFKNGVKSKEDKSPFQYVIQEILNPNYSTSIIGELTYIHFNYSKSNTEEGIKKLNEMANKILEDSPTELNFQAKADLQLILYMSLEHFLLNKNNTDIPAVAESLLKLTNYSSPLEVRVLSKALIVAKPVLAKADFNRIANYIYDLQDNKFENVSNSIGVENLTRLIQECDDAMKDLSSLSQD